MPFPLAHLAAVIPFRRWCPRYLSLVGLTVGSMTPDAGYIIRDLDLNHFTHSLAGSFLFCLPAGWLATVVVFWLREALVETLPAPHRQALQPFCARPRPAFWKLAISVLIGAWTHNFFDALTHESALVAYHAPPLENVAASLREKQFYQVLWIVVSLLGMGLVAWVYVAFVWRTTGSRQLLDWGDRRRSWLWCLLLVVPYLLVSIFCFEVFGPQGPIVNKHTIYRTFQPYLLLVTALIVVVGVVRRVRS
jgi:uncharacterized BrkB/YihY/UPF0761 family membrane protein